MALNSQYSTATRNAAAAARGALCNGGKLRIYDGVRPANANTAVTTQNLLAELALPNPAFGAAGAGAVVANAITSAAALLAGTASWFRIVESDGATVVADGDVGLATANLILNSTTITLPSQITVSSLTLTEPAAGT